MARTKSTGDKINYCKWCGAPTIMEAMQLPESPILEFLEIKIDLIGRNDVWGERADWSELNLDSDVEAELLVYDEMLGNVSLKHVCERCLSEDERLWKKYYGNPDDMDVVFWDDEF
jgi:hypothetical protein